MFHANAIECGDSAMIEDAIWGLNSQAVCVTLGLSTNTKEAEAVQAKFLLRIACHFFWGNIPPSNPLPLNYFPPITPFRPFLIFFIYIKVALNKIIFFV